MPLPSDAAITGIIGVVTTALGVASKLAHALYKSNTSSNARVERSVAAQGRELNKLTNEVSVLRTHLFGANGGNGLDSRVGKLEERADDGEQWQHDHKSVHQAGEIRLALVEERLKLVQLPRAAGGRG